MPAYQYCNVANAVNNKSAFTVAIKNRIQKKKKKMNNSHSNTRARCLNILTWLK